jgi:hypothetical protein
MIKRLPFSLWIFLLPVLLGLPFIGRAYFVDDHYHMAMAKGLLEHPLRPYDFRADDAGPDNAGWERGQLPRMVNPPGHHFLMALFWKISGGRLWAVRLGALLMSGLSALFLYRLAQWFLIPPGPAAVLSVLTPAFWLSSYALLIDPTMLTFFLGALLAWIEGSKKNSATLLILSGTLMGMTILTKYTGGFVGILAIAWWALQDRRARRWSHLTALLIPAAFLGLWSLWNVWTYGAPHLTESSKRVMQTFQWTHVLVFLVFFSGVLWAPLYSWTRLRRFGTKTSAGILILTSAMAVFLSGPLGGFSGTQAALMSVLAMGGLLFFLQIGRDLGTFLTRPADRFLAIWLFLGAIQMVYVMAWVAARYYLTLIPPAVFLLVRCLYHEDRLFPSRRNLKQTLLGAAMAAATFCLAWSDYAQAQTSRRIVEDTARDGWLAGGRRGYFLGDSFSGSYLGYAGWKSAFPETPLEPGDLLLHQQVTMPRWWFRAQPGRFRVLKVYEYDSSWPVRVMDNDGAAGFYASIWGALPFTISASPLERFVLLEVQPADKK